MSFFSFDQQDHTPSHPYCSDASCWCHNNSDYHSEIEHPERRTTESDVALARSFFLGTHETAIWGGAR